MNLFGSPPESVGDGVQKMIHLWNTPVDVFLGANTLIPTNFGRQQHQSIRRCNTLDTTKPTVILRSGCPMGTLPSVGPEILRRAYRNIEGRYRQHQGNGFETGRIHGYLLAPPVAVAPSVATTRARPRHDCAALPPLVA